MIDRKLYTFRNYQQATNETAIYRDSIKELMPFIGEHDREGVEKIEHVERLMNLSYVGLGLGEVGECQGKIKKLIRDSKGIISVDVQLAIKKELGDILWYVSQTAMELGLQLEDVAVENVEKLRSRMERGMIRGSGDDR